MVAHAALVGAAHAVVLDAVSLENLDAPIVHAHGDGDLQLAPGAAQQIAHTVIQAQPVGRPVEEDVYLVESVVLCCGGHVVSLPAFER